MVRLAAIIALFISFMFLAWRITHGIWDYRLFAVLGLFLWCVSDSWDYVPWRR